MSQASKMGSYYIKMGQQESASEFWSIKAAWHSAERIASAPGHPTKGRQRQETVRGAQCTLS
jgi:hypothetical protein